MDLTYPPEAEQFRVEIRQWLEEQPSRRLVRRGLRDDRRRAGGLARASGPASSSRAAGSAPRGPTEYGGKGLTTMQGVVLAEEFARAGAPMRGDFFGDTLVGPTILQWGTEEQKKQFIPGILSGTIAWCQGFSEPDAGSDLARSRPRPSSTATSGSSTARRSGPPRASSPTTCSCSAAPTRTPPSTRASPTCCAPWTSPASRCGPSSRSTAAAEFAEVFFTDARCPKDNVVGGLNNGWAVAMTTLGFERGTSATTGYRRFENELDAHHRHGRAQRRHRRPAGPPAPRQACRRRSRSCASTACARWPPCCRARRTGASPPSGPPTRSSGASTTRRS